MESSLTVTVDVRGGPWSMANSLLRGAAALGTERAARVANRALSITFQVLSDG